jgi:hypothetical protein
MEDANSSSSASPAAAVPRRTVSCALCGGAHIFPGPRLENHLVNEHGIVFDVDFMIQLSIFKQENAGRLPDLKVPLANGHAKNGTYFFTSSHYTVHTHGSMNFPQIL